MNTISISFLIVIICITFLFLMQLWSYHITAKGIKKNVQDSFSRVDSKLDNLKSLITKTRDDAYMQLVFFDDKLDAIQEKFKLQNQQIQNRFKNAISKLDGTNQSVLNSLKQLGDLIQKNGNEIKVMDSNLVKYLSKMAQLEQLYENMQMLYTNMLEEECKISKQEQSLTNTVSRLAQIYEITNEMNETSREIFEFMKLYLVQSTFDKIKK